MAKDEDRLISFDSSNPHPAHDTAFDDDTLLDETFHTMIHLPPPRLWDVMLDLVYTGHAERADRFLDQAWPPEAAGREEFRNDFWRTLIRGLLQRRSKGTTR